MTTTGRGAPVGATVHDRGVNFSLYSRDATRVELLLFDHEDDQSAREVCLDPAVNRTSVTN